MEVPDSLVGEEPSGEPGSNAALINGVFRLMGAGVQLCCRSFHSSGSIHLWGVSISGIKNSLR